MLLLVLNFFYFFFPVLPMTNQMRQNKGSENGSTKEGNWYF